MVENDGTENQKRSESLGEYLFCPKGTFSDWYHGRIEKDNGEKINRKKAWAVKAEEMFPNEINVFSKSKLAATTGVGSTYEESIENALEKYIKRIDKGEYDFIKLLDKLSVYSPNSVHTTVCAVLCKIDEESERNRRPDSTTTSIFLQY